MKSNKRGGSLQRMHRLSKTQSRTMALALTRFQSESRPHWSIYFSILAMLVLVAGCGRTTGPICYEVSGAVTYEGQPVPAGYILFAPDKAKGNDGPGVNAEIKDGMYRTPAGQGVIGGPHIATLCGYDGKAFKAGPISNPMGKPLFTGIQVNIDLPKQKTTHDFAVPIRKSK